MRDDITSSLVALKVNHTKSNDTTRLHMAYRDLTESNDITSLPVALKVNLSKRNDVTRLPMA